MFRSSRPGCSIKIVFLEISQNSQENTCFRVSFSIKLQAATLLKKRLWHRYFPVNFAKFLRTLFFTEHFQWLFLNVTTIFQYISSVRQATNTDKNTETSTLLKEIITATKTICNFITLSRTLNRKAYMTQNPGQNIWQNMKILKSMA